MKILYASDLHENRGHLPLLLELAHKHGADCVIIGGDIVPKDTFDGTIEQALLSQGLYLRNEFFPAIEKFKGKHKDIRIFLDMANDDFMANRRLLEEHDGRLFNLLHMRKHSLTSGIDIIGYMFVPPTPFGIKDWEKPDTEEEPYSSETVRTEGIRSEGGKIVSAYLDLYSDDTIEKDMEAISGLIDKPFILVSHCPPYGSGLDMLYSREHAGSRAIRKFIERWGRDGRLIASLHGHIHESPDVSGRTSDMIGDVLCVNPGQAHRLRYALLSVTGKEVVHLNSGNQGSG